MSQQLPFPALLLATLLFAACRPSPEDIPEIIVRIDPEFRVDLFDRRDTTDGSPAFGLWLEGLERQACPGYRLDASAYRSNDTLRVFLEGLLAPDPCTGDSAPLQDFIPLDVPAPGAYVLELHLGQAIANSGVLLAGNGQYEWILPKPAGIELRNRVVRRLPEGILWGYVRTPGEQDIAPANAFIDALKDQSADHGLPPGYYGYFTITGTGLPFFHESALPQGSALYFVRRFDEDALQNIRDLLTGFRNDNQHPVDVRCWSTSGKQ